MHATKGTEPERYDTIVRLYCMLHGVYSVDCYKNALCILNEASERQNDNNIIVNCLLFADNKRQRHSVTERESE